MGRRKLEIKPIQDKNTRQVTFSKRRKGLIKKAKELSILCDVDVAAVIFSNRGRLYDFSSNNSLTEIIQRYHNHVEAETPGISDTQNSKYASFMTTEELLQAVERELAEPDDGDDGISLTDLVHLENQLQIALMQARFRKTNLMIETVKSLHEKETHLTQENKVLKDKITTAKNNREVNGMALDFTNLEPTPMISEQQRLLLNFL